jgi:hypothetical protein
MSATQFCKKFSFQPQVHCGHTTSELETLIYAEINDRVEFCGNPRGVRLIEPVREYGFKVVKGLAELTTEIPLVTGKAAQEEGRGIVSIQMPTMTDDHAVLYAMAAGDQRDVLLQAEKAFEKIMQFDDLDWTEFGGSRALGRGNLMDYAAEALESGCPEKQAKFAQNLDGVTAQQVLALPSGLLQNVHFHYLATRMMPSAAPEAFERDAQALKDAFMQELYGRDGMAHVLDEHGEALQPVNEDDYLSTVYIDVRGLQPERLATLPQSKICSWAVGFPAGIKVSKGGPDSELEEHLISMGGDELESPVDHLRLFSVDDSRVLVAKLSNDYVERRVEPEIVKLLNSVDFIEASELPVWLMDAPQAELESLINSISHLLPDSVMEHLRDAEGKTLISAARVLSANGELSDVYVCTEASPYLDSANFFPVLSNSSAKVHEKAMAAENDLGPSL